MTKTYIVRQDTITKPWEEESNGAYVIYNLANINKPVFNSGQEKAPFFSKPTLWKDESSKYLHFRFFTVHQNRKLTLPIQEETIEEASVSISRNPHDYHQDWPFEIREAKIKLNGESVNVHYFLLMRDKDQV